MPPLGEFLGRFTQPLDRLLKCRLGLPACILLACLIAYTAWTLFEIPLRYYRLHSDDFKYFADARTLERAFANLYTPHNTHIVPAWRILCGLIATWAGSLANLPHRLAITTFSILVFVMLQVAWLVTRESRSQFAGLFAMAATGISWLMDSAATWFSAGQTLWAAAGILLTLQFTQSYRLKGGAWKLAGAALGAWLAGSFWTIGHIAGPVAAIDLWADGRKSSRRAACIPFLASILTAASALALGGSKIDATISFHGRTSEEALNIPMGLSHTLQSIPETLVIGNLGLKAPTTPSQGALLAALLALLWLFSWRTHGPFAPLGFAGAALVVSAYAIEWSFRGYLPFTSLRGVVRWYDTIPHIGFILAIAGWWARSRSTIQRIEPLRLGQALALALIILALPILHRPRTEELLFERVPAMDPVEAEYYLTQDLQRRRAIALCEQFSIWQINHLRKLDQAEALARRLGLGLAELHAAFGKLKAPECPDVYDAARLLALPEHSDSPNPPLPRLAFLRFFEVAPEPILPHPRILMPGNNPAAPR
jgi:hypothetical protein